MTPQEVLTRARSAIGRRTVYKLGAGGMKPLSPQPGDAVGACDCSGFAAWCLGVSRKTENPWYVRQNGGWIETSAIYHDADTPHAYFTGVEWKDAKPSDLLVWPDQKDDDGIQHQGHVGIVTEVDGSGPTSVVHCSAGNFRATGDAIQESDALIFAQHQARVARCAWVREEVTA